MPGLGGAESQRLPVRALWMSRLRAAGEVEVGEGGQSVAVAGDGSVPLGALECLLSGIVRPAPGKVSGEKPDLVGFVGQVLRDVVSRVVAFGPVGVLVAVHFPPDGVVVTLAQFDEQRQTKMIAALDRDRGAAAAAKRSPPRKQMHLLRDGRGGMNDPDGPPRSVRTARQAGDSCVRITVLGLLAEWSGLPLSVDSNRGGSIYADRSKRWDYPC